MPHVARAYEALAHEMLASAYVRAFPTGSLFFVGICSTGACAHREARSAARPIVVEDRGCPMDLPDARVAMTELEGAIALDFTAPGYVGELRSGLLRIGARAVTANLDHGVRVTLAPEDPREYDALETRARRAVFELNHGDCSSLDRGLLVLIGPDLELATER